MTDSTQNDDKNRHVPSDYQLLSDQKMIDQLEYDIRRLEKLLNRVILSDDPVQKTLSQSYQAMIGKREELLAMLYERQMMSLEGNGEFDKKVG